MLTSLLGGGASKHEIVGYVSAFTIGTALTANATPGNDGAYTQLIAATANDWNAFTVMLHYGGTSTARGIIDLAIGAGGSEIIILADLPFTHLNSNLRSGTSRIWLPLGIAKNSRIAARIHRCDIASQTMRIMLVGETHPTRGIPPFQRATSYGVVLANAMGTVVNPGDTANTLGANTQIVASTTNPIRAMYVLSAKQDAAAVAVNFSTALEFYVGAGGSEVVLLPEMLAWDLHSSNDTQALHGWGIGPFLVNVPAASRISAKARCSNNTAGAREGQVIVIGLD